MAYTIGEVKQHLIGMGHSGTLNRVRNLEAMCERAANTMGGKIKILETICVAELAQAVYDKVYNYQLPANFDSVIDLYPEDDRNSLDAASAEYAGTFDRRKAIDTKKISLESANGVKFMRIDWATASAIVLNTMNSYNGNGTWMAVGSATNIGTDTLRKITGTGSVKFDVVVSGDGIKNTTQSAVNMSSVDGEGDFFVQVYLPAITGLTSISAKWGNDLTLKYWTGVAQTAQFDGTAFAIGWNLIAFPWATATETGVVDDTLIDSFQLTFASTVAIPNIRVDNIVVSLGRYFYLKYYSKFLFQTPAGAWEAQPTENSDDDYVMVDADSYQIFLLELLKAMAQQLEGTDSAFDMGWADTELSGNPRALDISARLGLYALYRKDHPDQRKKITDGFYSPTGNVSRGRW